MTLRTIAETLPFTYTGADLYALCSDAMLKAITRQAGRVDEKIRVMSEDSGEPMSTAYFFDHVASEEDTTVVVGEGDFASAKSELVGSVRYVLSTPRGALVPDINVDGGAARRNWNTTSAYVNSSRRPKMRKARRKARAKPKRPILLPPQTARARASRS